MQEKILINNLSEFIYIDRLDDIIKVASLTKAKMIYASKNDNRLYGSFEEPYSVIYIDCPIPISNDIWFSNTMYSSNSAKNSITNNRDFFYVREYPFMLFPVNRRADLVNGNISFDYEYFIFIDNLTGNQIDDCLLMYTSDEQFNINKFKNNYRIWSNNLGYYTSSPASVFKNAEKYESIQWVANNKVTQGSTIMTLCTNTMKYTFYVFKPLIGSLTKQDKLTINLYPDIVIPTYAVIEFIVHKNKIKIPSIPDFKIGDIHTFVRIISL